MECATNNGLMFNGNKSRTTHMSRRRCKEMKEIKIYISNTIIKQENTIKQLAVIFYSKQTQTTSTT